MSVKYTKAGIAYLSYRSSSSRLPIILLHGHGSDHRALSKLSSLLSGPVYAIDLPGFGSSKNLSEHTMSEYAKSLKNFAKDLGFNEYIIAGHSLGSAIALYLSAHDSRVANLILINPVPSFRPYIKQLLLAAHGVVQNIPTNAANRLINARMYDLASYLLLASRRDPKISLRSYLLLQSGTSHSSKSWAESGIAIYELDQISLVAKVKIPILLIHGQKDRMVSKSSVDEFIKKAANATLAVVPDSGHFLPIEQPSKLARLIDDFVY